MKKADISEDIRKDILRAKQALISAERNEKEIDLSTSANRIFVACESIAYVFLKVHFGSGSISRQRILTKLNEIHKSAKKIYEETYDLRVQADYGRKAIYLPLTKENINNALEKVKVLLKEAEESFMKTL